MLRTSIVCVIILTIAPVWANGESKRSVLYPQAPKTIRFKHASHAKTGCSKCHESVSKSVSAGDQNSPRESVCRGCHADITRSKDSDRIAKESEKAGCKKCHVSFDTRGIPRAGQTNLARLRFSHRLHHDRGIPCGSCHGNSASITMPAMASCIDCHGKKKVSLRCQSCHLTEKSGRLKTSFGADKVRLIPRGTAKGASHTAIFRKRHAGAAMGNKRYCETCHAPADCLACHGATLKPMAFHRNDYVSHHVLDARKNDPKCASCHQSQSFCLSCHLRTGVGQDSRNGGFKPNTGQRFHRPGFTSTTVGPTHHSYAARRNAAACASCHREESCIRCHGTRQLRRGGYSPHGPGFRRSAKCRSLASRNQRVCVKCHRVDDPNVSCK
jgi:hypothetical protein